MAKRTCKGCGFRTITLEHPEDPYSWIPKCNLGHSKISKNSGCSDKLERQVKEKEYKQKK